jgi:hypothetical protein
MPLIKLARAPHAVVNQIRGTVLRQHFRKINGNLGTKWKNRKIQKSEKQRTVVVELLLVQMEIADDQSDQSEAE